MYPSHRYRRWSLRESTLMGAFVCMMFSCNDEVQMQPLLDGCLPDSNAASLPIGVGKDAFSPLNSVENTLIVGGYQGGYHLWGALQLPNRDVSHIQRLHMVACIDDAVVAEALYGKPDGLPHGGETVFGVPIVFMPHVEVWTLGGQRVTIVAAVQSGATIYGASGITHLRCCGHVADGD